MREYIDLFESIRHEKIINEYVDFIYENCQQFLKESEFIPAYRGMTVPGDKHYAGFHEWRERTRRPKDIPYVVHDAVNYQLDELGFKARRDNSIFISGSKSIAVHYGPPYLIFPLDGYSYTWSPDVHDLYDLYPFAQLDLKHNAIQQALNDIPNFRFLNTNLSEALNSKNEIYLYSPEGYVAIYSSIEVFTFQKLKTLMGEK